MDSIATGRAIMFNRLLDYYSAHPKVDLWASLAVTLCATYAVGSIDSQALQIFLPGVSAFGGLVLASFTFTYGLFTQIDDPRVTELRHKYHRLVTNNWLSIVRDCLVCAATSLVILLAPANLWITMACGLFCLILTTFRGLRGLYWFCYTLRIQEQLKILPPITISAKPIQDPHCKTL